MDLLSYIAKRIYFENLSRIYSTYKVHKFDLSSESYYDIVFKLWPNSYCVMCAMQTFTRKKSRFPKARTTYLDVLYHLIDTGIGI